jgi:hypothetical protein
VLGCDSEGENDPVGDKLSVLVSSCNMVLETDAVSEPKCVAEASVDSVPEGGQEAVMGGVRVRESVTVIPAVSVSGCDKEAVGVVEAVICTVPETDIDSEMVNAVLADRDRDGVPSDGDGEAVRENVDFSVSDDVISAEYVPCCDGVEDGVDDSVIASDSESEGEFVAGSDEVTERERDGEAVAL